MQSLRVIFGLATIAIALSKPCVLESNITRLVRLVEAADELSLHSELNQTMDAMPAAGPYVARFDRISHIPGLTMGGKTSAVIIYPSVIDEAATDNSTFPLLSFAHATYIGGLFPPTDTSYKTLMNTVVSYGFIVVAPETCADRECASAFAKDQVATIDACKTNPSLHPALSRANFDKVGVFGHSMGAMATIASAGGSSLGIKPAAHNIVAAVSMHPCQDIYERAGSVDVPILFTTGSADTICTDGCADRFYSQVSKDKVILSVSGANHFDPTNRGSNREVQAIGLFFACWVRGEHCEDAYGPSGEQICKQVVHGTTAECHVSGTPVQAGSTASRMGSSGVQVDDVTIGGLKCDGIQTGHVAYPADMSRKYPLLSFAHGWTEGGSFVKGNYQDVIEKTAAAGYVVVAEHSGLERLCYADEKADQLRAIDYVKQTPKYSNMVDWAAKVGVYGHSMGGAASGLNAADASTISKYNLGAAVMLHPAQGGQAAHTKLPAFYATGSADAIVPPSGVKMMYNNAQGPKVFAEMSGAGHFECQNKEAGLPMPAGWTTYVKSWFDCHIKGSQSDCATAYNVCDAIKTTECEVVKAAGQPQDRPVSTTEDNWFQDTHPEHSGNDYTTKPEFKHILSAEMVASEFPICGHAVTQYSQNLRGCFNMKLPINCKKACTWTPDNHCPPGACKDSGFPQCCNIPDGCGGERQFWFKDGCPPHGKAC